MLPLSAEMARAERMMLSRREAELGAGPFFRDEVHAEGGLFWWAYTANKRGITLDLTTADGEASVDNTRPIFSHGPPPPRVSPRGLPWVFLSQPVTGSPDPRALAATAGSSGRGPWRSSG